MTDVEAINPYITNYDAFRFNKIVIMAKPCSNALPMGQSFPQIVDVIDYDDQVAPTTTNGLTAFGTAQVHRGDKEWSRKFTPAIRQLAFVTATTNSYTQKFKQWLDAANVDVPHYGYKIQLAGLTAGSYQIELWAKYYYSCKQQR